MDAVATRMSTLAPVRESGSDVFLTAMAEPINAQALDLIDGLTSKGDAATAQEWKLARSALPWDQVDSVIWRCIGLMTYNNPLGQWFFQGALVQRFIHFEDFCLMADHWENVNFDSTKMVMKILPESAKHCGRLADGKLLVERIINSGPVSYEAQRWWWAG